MEWLAAHIADPHPQVRLEAINVLREVGNREAVELALSALDHPTDAYIDFALFRIVHERLAEPQPLLHTFERSDKWLADFQGGKLLLDGDPQRIAFALSSVAAEGSLSELAVLVQSNSLPPGALIDALVVLAALGESEQRELAVDRIGGMDAGDQVRVLTSLLQSTRRNSPADASSIVALVESPNDEVRALAIAVSGRWGLSNALRVLQRRAADAGG